MCIGDVEAQEEKDAKRILKYKNFTDLINWDAKGFGCRHKPEELFKSDKYDNVKLLDLCELNPTTTFLGINEEMVAFVPMDDVSAEFGTIEKQEFKSAKYAKGYTKFKDNDILWAKISPCMQNGKCFIAKDLENGYGFGSTEFNVFRTTDRLLPEYLFIFLRSKKLRDMATNFFTGTAGQQRVSKKFFEELTIPIVKKSGINNGNITQEEIVKTYNGWENELNNISRAINNLSKDLTINFENKVYS